MLGRVQLRHGVREILVVVLVEFIGVSTELVGPRLHNCSDQVFRVITMIGEVLGQRVQEVVIGGRVRVAKVIDGIDDAPPTQMKPDAIGQRLGHKGIVAGSHPVGQGLAAIGAGRECRRGAPHEFGGHGLTRARLRYFIGAIEVNEFRPILGLRCRTRLGRVLPLLYPREPGGHAVVVILRPALERMIVALGTLHANAEEELRRGLRQGRGIARDAIVVRGWIGESAAAGRQHFPDDLIEAVVVFNMAAQPGVEDMRPLSWMDLRLLRNRSAHLSVHWSAYSGRSSS